MSETTPCHPVASLPSSRIVVLERVRQEVELIYVNNRYSPAERIGYAKNKSFNPYPAEFDPVEGIEWMGRITCGPNPFLYARLVDNLAAGGDGADEAEVTWMEREPLDVTKYRRALRHVPR